MISQITNIAKIESLIASLKVARFNSILPLTVDVLDRVKQNQYLLRVGTKELNTKSLVDLEVGSKYWALMKEDISTNSISISNLLKKPKLLQMQREGFLPQFTAEKLAQLISKDNPKIEFKAMLLERLSSVTTKSEFMTIVNMLSALNENIFTMLLKDGDSGVLFQFKKRKKVNLDSKDEGVIDFYAAFDNLGPIEGEISVVDDRRRVTLNLFYENSLEFLKGELKNLDLDGVLYHKTGDIDPIYEPLPSLLDLKG